MARSAVWAEIAGILRAEIAGGQYRPGERLPTEAEMARRFAVNRHTLRRAVAALVGEGSVHTRRGSGAFVTSRPTDYPIGRRVRFHQNVAASGRTPSRRILRLETRRADPTEAAALHLPEGAPVHVIEGLSLADDVPLAVFRSVFPAERFPALLEHLAVLPSVTAALKSEGLADYTRSETRLTAGIAGAVRARHLQVPDGAPVLKSVSINVDPEGQPVEYGETWFAGERVTLTVSQT
jgi:GntR family transcriptional regulator, phosphonate transport system regulatory protein